MAGGGGQQTVVSVDRQGRASPLPGLPLDSYRDVRVSPDGARLALATQTDVWIYDFAARNAEPADDRPGAGHAPALDARRPAHHLYVETSGLPRAVLAAGGWHRQRRAAPRACQGSPRSARQRLVGRRQTAPVYRGAAEPSVRDRADRHRAPVRREGAGEKRVLQRLRGRVSRRTLDGLRVERVRSTRRSMSSGIRSSEIGNRSRRAAAISRSGRVTAGNCSSAAWTVGRCLRSRCSPGRRSSPGVRRCCSNSQCSWLSVGLGRTTSPPMDGS